MPEDLTVRTCHRTKREENPKRLYVFFRDADDARLDPSFAEFKKGFAEKLGHFFCAFENADTLKLNFLLSLENLLGDWRRRTPDDSSRPWRVR